MPILIFMKLGIYIMAPEPILTAYFINPSHQSVSVCVLDSIVATQRLGEKHPRCNEYTQQKNWTSFLCGPCRLKAELVNVCIPLPFLGNGSVNTFPKQRRIVGGIVFNAVCAVSEKSRRSVHHRNCCLMLSYNSQCAFDV
jgi:hypothetical protein